jgi:hypothetical protein
LWFQASAAILMRYALFWSITQHWMVILYQHSRTTYWSYLQGPSIKDYHSTRHNTPEEIWYECTTVLEDHAASIFYPEDGSSAFPQKLLNEQVQWCHIPEGSNLRTFNLWTESWDMLYMMHLLCKWKDLPCTWFTEKLFPGAMWKLPPTCKYKRLLLHYYVI